MPLSINDAGTWRTIKKVSVNDAGTWRDIKKISVNNGGTWQVVFNATTLAFDPNVSFQADDTDVSAGVSTSTASFQLNSDGTITIVGNTTNSGPSKWIDPTSTGIGSNYEAQVVISTLTNLGGSGAGYHDYVVLGTAISWNQATPYTSAWTALSSNRLTRAKSTGLTAGTPDSSSLISGTVYIREIGTTTPVTSVSFSISSEASAY